MEKLWPGGATVFHSRTSDHPDAPPRPPPIPADVFAGLLRGDRRLAPVGVAGQRRDDGRGEGGGRFETNHSAAAREILLRLPRRRREQGPGGVRRIQVGRGYSVAPRSVVWGAQECPGGDHAAGRGRGGPADGRGDRPPYAVDQGGGVAARCCGPGSRQGDGAAAQPDRVSQHDQRPHGRRVQQRGGVSARRLGERFRQHRGCADGVAVAVGEISAGGGGDCGAGGAEGGAGHAGAHGDRPGVPGDGGRRHR